MHDIAGKSRESGKDSAEEKKGNPSVYVPYTQQLKRAKKARVHYFFFQLLPGERGAADASTTQGASTPPPSPPRVEALAKIPAAPSSRDIARDGSRAKGHKSRGEKSGGERESGRSYFFSRYQAGATVGEMVVVCREDKKNEVAASRF